MCLFSKSLTFRREELDIKSQKAGKILNDVRNEAKLYGRNQQIERLKERLGVDGDVK